MNCVVGAQCRVGDGAGGSRAVRTLSLVVRVRVAGVGDVRPLIGSSVAIFPWACGYPPQRRERDALFQLCDAARIC